MKSSVISKVGSLLLMEVDQLVRIVLLLFIYHHVSWQKVVYGLKSETNRALRLQEEYNKHLRPNHKGTTDNVTVGIRIYSIGPISETEMTMSFDCYFRLKWQDVRLVETAKFLIEEDSQIPNFKYSESVREELGILLNDSVSSPTTTKKGMSRDYEGEEEGGGESKRNQTVEDFVLLGEEYAEAIWSPDLFFPDAVDIERPGMGILSDSSVLVLYISGEVFRSMRLQVKSRCKLDLTLFPMDVQVCDVCVESYQYHSLDVNVSWGDDLVTLEEDKVRKYGTANFDIIYQAFDWRRETQVNFNYPYVTLCLTIELRRKLSIYLITIYLPSISLVVLSWVGFWIDKRAVPARASLTITTILAQITLITGAANQFPGIADLKLVDLYLIVNFFYVFASLIEFALVSYEPPVKSIGKSWLQNTRERMRMMNAKMPSESPRGDPSNYRAATRRKLSTFIRPKKVSRCSNDEVEPMTYCNTVAQPKKKEGVSAIKKSALKLNDDDVDKSIQRIVSSNNIKATLVKLDTEPTIFPHNPQTQTQNTTDTENEFKALNGFKKQKLRGEPRKPKKGRLALRIERIKKYFNEKNADDVSKIIFPLTFILWNAIYFGLSFSLADRFHFN
ncbi:glycine receptor subunit alpha-2-like [Convolutriloba macropyga]|uniref:glycine receptor subunit alpha-2-like n=1 Tax=Convolutriloba macropyga TaxID=536237 RepID=UPI003F51D493